MLVDLGTAHQSSPSITVLWNFIEKASYSLSPYLAALSYHAVPPASASPTRTTWRPLHQRSIILMTLYQISLSLYTPRV